MIMSEYPIVGYKFGSCELDIKGGRLLRDGLPRRIDRKGLEVFERLIKRQGDVVPKEEL